MIDETALIDSIRLYEVNIPLKDPFQISGGVSYSRRSLIVELSAEGCRGYGESAPFEEPYYSSETISSVKSLYRELLFPRTLHKKIDSIEHMNQIINFGVRGNNFAKAGIENAYWDLTCQRNKITLKDLIVYKLKKLELTGSALKSEDFILSGVSIGIPVNNDIGQLKEWVREYLSEGYRRIKIKIRPDWEVEPLKAARDIIGDYPLTTDANASFDFGLHKDIFRRMDEFQCLYFEQPLHQDDILDHAKLSRYVQTPICLDESLKSAIVARQAAEIGAAEIWNIKIQRIGGLWEGLMIYKLAIEKKVKLWGGTMPESSIGAIPILNLASFNGFKFPADVEASARWYGAGNDLFEIRMDSEGRIKIPECRGIEEIINFDNFKKYGQLITELA